MDGLEHYIRSMPTLKDDFTERLLRHEVVEDRANELWQEVVAAHTSSSRHYHTLQHLEDLHAKLSEIKASLQNFDAVLLAIVYHDFVYRVSRKDNGAKCGGDARTDVGDTGSA
jgi:predicted metal-dependent HD superfamily phosphohydrolase